MSVIRDFWNVVGPAPDDANTQTTADTATLTESAPDCQDQQQFCQQDTEAPPEEQQECRQDSEAPPEESQECQEAAGLPQDEQPACEQENETPQEEQHAYEQEPEAHQEEQQACEQAPEAPQEEEPVSRAGPDAPEEQPLAPDLQSITISPKNHRFILIGEQVNFCAIGVRRDGSSGEVTDIVEWSSSAADVVSITGSGVATAEQGPGTAMIGARYPKDDLGDATEVRVTGIGKRTKEKPLEPKLQSITISPASHTFVLLGQQQPFTATGVLFDGSTKDVTDIVEWSSCPTDVVSINSSGLANAEQGPGTATVMARYEGGPPSISVEVRVTGVGRRTVDEGTHTDEGPTAADAYQSGYECGQRREGPTSRWSFENRPELLPEYDRGYQAGLSDYQRPDEARADKRTQLRREEDQLEDEEREEDEKERLKVLTGEEQREEDPHTHVPHYPPRLPPLPPGRPPAD